MKIQRYKFSRLWPSLSSFRFLITSMKLSTWKRFILEEKNNTNFRDESATIETKEEKKKKEKEIFRISLFKQISFLVSPRRRKWSAASGKGNSYKTKRRKGVIYSLNSDINFGLQPNAWWAVKSSFKPKGTNDSQLPVVFSHL